MISTITVTCLSLSVTFIIDLASDSPSLALFFMTTARIMAHSKDFVLSNVALSVKLELSLDKRCRVLVFYSAD